MSLRILMTADAVGGVWQYALGLSEALGRRGCEVLLAVCGPAPDPRKRRQAEAVRGLRLFETVLPLDWLCNEQEPVEQAAGVLAELAVSERVDVFHCNMPTLAGAATFPVPVVAMTHGCVSSWWEAARDTPLAPEFHWHRRMMQDGLRAADIVVAPSAAYAAAIARHYRLRSLPDVVHNGTSPVARRREPPLVDGAITVGRMWDPVKGASILDQVASDLAVPFYAAGAVTGPHGESCALEHLHSLGELDREALSKQLAVRPIFVSAASFEPFGLAVLEAAGAGCALVLSDIPTFRELWDDAALFAPAGDPAAYRNAINWLLSDPWLRFSLGEAAAARAERYTPEATAKGMIEIYRTLLASPSKKGLIAA